MRKEEMQFPQVPTKRALQPCVKVLQGRTSGLPAEWQGAGGASPPEPLWFTTHSHPLKSEEHQNRYVWKITLKFNAVSKILSNSFVR
jgi:hypothetical protein